MATFYPLPSDVTLPKRCADHGTVLPRQTFWRGSELYTCPNCMSRFAYLECLCDLVHECRKVGA